MTPKTSLLKNSCDIAQRASQARTDRARSQSERDLLDYLTNSSNLNILQ